MHSFSRFGAVIALPFFVALVNTSPAQNVGTARVNGAPQINSGRVEGNVQQMTGANVTLNGGAVITGASVLDNLFPGGIKLGLSGEQLKSIRPKAAKSPFAVASFRAGYCRLF